MRVAFAGTPAFAARALEAILAAGFEVPLVLTQPDRPAGRGMQLRPSAVKELAMKHGLPLHQPERLKDPATHAPLREARAEFMVVAAYGLILPQSVLDIPTRGCLNIHASLLPRWRGAAPIQRAIEAGDDQTGVTIMRMEAGLDTGPMLLAEALPIGANDTAGSLHDRLANLGARLIVEALHRIDQLVPVAQPDHASYARKIEKAESQLDWRLPAIDLDRKIRAFNPAPGAAALLHQTPLKVWRAVPVAGSGVPGSVLAVTAEGIDVACGEGVLRLQELQKAGSKRLPVGDFLKGFPIVPGARFGLPDA